jgi:quinol monooxygenase YgiN
MQVCSVWESFFPVDAAAKGRELTEGIWRDMLDCEGYISHQLIQDQDDPGHLLVVSVWASRKHADDTLRDYMDPKIARVNSLVARPRTRFVGAVASSGA